MVKVLIFLTKNTLGIPEHLFDVNVINNHFLSVSSNAIASDLLDYYASNTGCNYNKFFSYAVTSEEQVAHYLLWRGRVAKTVKVWEWLKSVPHLSFHLSLINFYLRSQARLWNLNGRSSYNKIYYNNNVFLLCRKQAFVTPIPKTSTFTLCKDLRPISNLLTLSKILEKNMKQQLRICLSKFNVLPSVQSGFRAGFSCATALSAVDYILSSLNEDNVVVLVLLEFNCLYIIVNVLIWSVTHLFIRELSRCTVLLDAYFSVILTNVSEKSS